jgi:hypothetical protein
VQHERPTTNAPREVWISFYEQMAAFLRGQEDVVTWRGEMEDRMESVEEMTRLVPAILERLEPVTLSPEHQASVKAAVKRLHEVSGTAYPTIHTELQQTFHVGTYTQIPDELWAEVAEWFKHRIDAASTRRHPPSKRATAPAQPSTPSLFQTSEDGEQPAHEDRSEPCPTTTNHACGSATFHQSRTISR